MFAVDHSATALLLKRRFPSVPMTPLLVSVQAMELAWVALNYLGVEHTTTASSVRSVADIHLGVHPLLAFRRYGNSGGARHVVDHRAGSWPARPRTRSRHRDHVALDS